MADILNNFLSSVFPVALMFFLGFWLARRGVFTGTEAEAILKFIARLAAPAILVSILVTSDFGAADLSLVGLYLLGEVILYATTALIGVWLFRLDFKNAILVGIGASFSNHVMFAYPIAQFAFPAEMTLPVRGIIAFDIIIFALSIVLLDINAGAGRGVAAAAVRQARNPLLLALVFGLLVNLAPVEPPLALVRGAGFIADTAAPCGLFAAGVLLAAPLDRSHIRLAGYITGMKMLVHPLLAAGLILVLGGYALDTARTSLLVAVSPVGIMALTFASRYGGEKDAIALSILWSFVLSVLAIPVLLAL
ncbi:AEC family transporter [Alphaproteobacteria bacterium LSUCC0719]